MKETFINKGNKNKYAIVAPIFFIIFQEML